MLSAPVWTTCSAIGGAAVLGAAWRANKKMDERHVPLLGVSGAFVFAAQMLNFPIPGGTSGHFVGGALVGILLGPSASVVVLASVLLIQCIVFRDGGVTALGANLINMGLLGGVLGGVLGSLTKDKKKLRPLVGFFAGWLACVLGALACSLELVLSERAPANVIFPAMGGVHALIGIGEGAITASALSLLATVRPDLLELERF
jgi:cobalt/nickel transport system permease protein